MQIDTVQMMSFIIDRKHRKYWKPLYNHYESSVDAPVLLLQQFSNSEIILPTEKQSFFIYRLYQDAIKAGWSPNEK
jgi:hypothetical protein